MLDDVANGWQEHLINAGVQYWQPTPVFLPGGSQGQGSLVGCRLWGRTEPDTPEATQQQQQQQQSACPQRLIYLGNEKMNEQRVLITWGQKSILVPRTLLPVSSH